MRFSMPWSYPFEATRTGCTRGDSMRLRPTGAVGIPGLMAVAAALLTLTAPAAVASIGTDVMGLFERVTIGVYSLSLARVPADAGRATAPV